jgi:hypothetical protein
MPRQRIRTILVSLLCAGVLAGGATLVAAAQPSGTPNAKKSNTGGLQYKPGCGPDKTNGVAGNSGQHIGQPPKDQNRGDCPNPPGQQK